MFNEVVIYNQDRSKDNFRTNHQRDFPKKGHSLSIAIKPWYFFFPHTEPHAATVHVECGTGSGNGGVSGRRLKLVLFKIKPSVNQGGS